jgi:hypothetical protein
MCLLSLHREAFVWFTVGSHGPIYCTECIRYHVKRICTRHMQCYDTLFISSSRLNHVLPHPSSPQHLLLHHNRRTQRLECLDNLLGLLLWYALLHHLRRALHKLLALMTFGFAPASNFSSLRLNSVFSAAAGAASSSSTGAAAGAAPPAGPPPTKPPIGMSGMFRRSCWTCC